jgi:hypothetical protein|tara:strand:- start:361 stop:927 length:567 start_codon:yes stop_codon:yes gene_type:complete
MALSDQIPHDLSGNHASDFSALFATRGRLFGFCVEFPTSTEEGSKCGYQASAFEDPDHRTDWVWTVEEIATFNRVFDDLLRDCLPVTPLYPNDCLVGFDDLPPNCGQFFLRSFAAFPDMLGASVPNGRRGLVRQPFAIDYGVQMWVPTVSGVRYFYRSHAALCSGGPEFAVTELPETLAEGSYCLRVS